MQAVETLITTTMRSWLVLAGTLITVVLIPIFGFVAYWLRRGPMGEVKDVKRDLDALGQKVDQVDKDQRQTAIELRALERAIVGNQQELIDLITANGKAHTEELHHVDREVAKLQERSDISGCMDRLGSRIEHAITVRTKRGE